VLAHYQNLAPWRRDAATREDAAARVWIDGEEVADVFGRFADVLLTREPAIEISGASGVSLMLAMAQGRDWSGHVPGPRGLPGGYPVKFAGEIALDLPAALTRSEAIAWNLRYEQDSGLVIDPDGHATYTGVLRDRLAAHSRDLAAGFHVGEIETAFREMSALRTRLEREPA
jgi:hypothetical protein